jgi:hypothetical protein
MINHSSSTKSKNDTKKNGRPRGTTLEAKKKRKESKEQAISWAAQRLKLLTKDPLKTDENGRWKRGVIKDLANEARKKFNVDERDEIKVDTIRQRFNRGKPDRLQRGPDSILKEVEPIFISTCIAMQRILMPLDENTFLE